MPNVLDISKPRLYLLQWLKSDRALMMLFNDGTFQVQLGLDADLINFLTFLKDFGD